MWPVIRSKYLAAILVAAQLVATFDGLVKCQLPDDIQRELNQSLEEQAKIQAMRQQHQKQIQSRTGAGNGQTSAKPAFDPNNYSFQQVSPPIQYSYYQPYGDAAAAPQQAGAGSGTGSSSGSGSGDKLNFDLNNLNFELPQPQAQVAASGPSSVPQQQQHYTPSFTGAGGLPVMQPLAGAPPAGHAPLAPQARVQQGPPLTEADFRDITGGENYGAPAGNDFGLGDAASGGGASGGRGQSTDAQLREFGLPGGDASATGTRNQAGGPQISIPDFGAFNPIGAGPSQRLDAGGSGSPFDVVGGAGFPSGGRRAGGRAPAGDFDFATEPSGERGDQAAAALDGGAPGSLQSLLGAGFPGLGAGAGDTARASGSGGLDDVARVGGASDAGDPAAQDADLFGQLEPQAQRGQRAGPDAGLEDFAGMGDQFSGADLGAFGQQDPQAPSPKDSDFGLAGAASDQQPRSVPYPDGSPQPVGTLLALTQPQSLTQTRYSLQPDKGTYQDYPAYQSGGNPRGAVRAVVAATPPAHPPALEPEPESY